jgi:HD-GYP domain-containing protein (c-di-GMP phosphodiesterase class II)
VDVHPILGYRHLHGQGVPDAICDPALQHHERLNGKGYPKHLKDIEISEPSRIIAVACSYEAMSAPRPHLKGRKNGHDCLLELLKNEEQRYDYKVVRALVAGLSIYPLGMRVLLSDGKHAEVADVGKFSPLYPLVLTSEGKMETSPKGLTIERALTQKELDAEAA